MAESERGPGKLSAEDLEYLRSQAGSAGSGLLGGWSEVEYGGWFDEGRRAEEVQAELAPLRALTSTSPANPNPAGPPLVATSADGAEEEPDLG